MKKYISLSMFPGKTGEYFYNNFFKFYGVDAEYKAYQCNNLESSIQQAIRDNISGISISMPYKKTVIGCLNAITMDCFDYNSCNTIVNNNGYLTGHNSDLSGVAYTCQYINKNDSITVLGDGAMASMYITYLKKYNVTQCARRMGTWDARYEPTGVIINATGLGTNSEESPFIKLPDNARLVIDLSVKQGQLKSQCSESGVKYIGGKDFYKEQFKTQFKIYTGIIPEDKIYDEFNETFFA